ncbi:MAG: EamA family transporter [Hyphomicrobium sp.]|nr:EamA family transporter [Hyphomicrobium sp.]
MNFTARARPLATLLCVLALLASMVSLAIGTSLAKHLFAVVGAEGTTVLRVGFAAIILLALYRPWTKPLDRGRGVLIAVYGTTLGFMNFLFYCALRTIPLGLAVAIEFIGPLAVALLASRRAQDFVWIGFAVLGLALLMPISGPTSKLDPVGIAFALGAGVCWALYIVTGQRVGKANGGQAVALGMVVAALVVAPFGAINASVALDDKRLLLQSVGVAILSSALPYSLEMVALRDLPRQTFGVLLSLEPVICALAGLAFLDEHLTVQQWTAIACVITASAGSMASLARATKSNSPNVTLAP